MECSEEEQDEEQEEEQEEEELNNQEVDVSWREMVTQSSPPLF